MVSVTNVGMGLSLFGSALSKTGMAVLWIYIGYIGFFLALTFFLFLLFTILGYVSTGEGKWQRDDLNS